MKDSVRPALGGVAPSLGPAAAAWADALAAGVLRGRPVSGFGNWFSDLR
ncbi:hypothetical protein [Streptomyces chiangmaiensis]|uniref:Uncharacterized protein n=1 Tax=Streptomyces chiangmaiensis TaxID=766497 RepID=A0ABU7FTX1_9ACTN|nr:hypothetical protein [Streptomyces chiangmaiensis]MED7827404.1 hypothetical protein [Streptomyces chiangmaiensis]